MGLVGWLNVFHADEHARMLVLNSRSAFRNIHQNLARQPFIMENCLMWGGVFWGGVVLAQRGPVTNYLI